MNKKRMQEAGLEPAQSCDHRHLKPARLPIPPFLHILESFAEAVLSLAKDTILDSEENVNSFFKFF